MKRLFLCVALALIWDPVALAASAATASVSGPRIIVEPEEFDFGKAPQNQELKKQFVIRNVGTEDLVIERVTTTCGCTVAEGYTKVVRPGESTNMEVRLKTRTLKGPIERRVLVRSNDVMRDPLEFKVQVTIVTQ